MESNCPIYKSPILQLSKLLYDNTKVNSLKFWPIFFIEERHYWLNFFSFSPYFFNLEGLNIYYFLNFFIFNYFHLWINTNLLWRKSCQLSLTFVGFIGSSWTFTAPTWDLNPQEFNMGYLLSHSPPTKSLQYLAKSYWRNA